jgi:hypothetical protein
MEVMGKWSEKSQELQPLMLTTHIEAWLNGLSYLRMQKISINAMLMGLVFFLVTALVPLVKAQVVASPPSWMPPNPPPGFFLPPNPFNKPGADVASLPVSISQAPLSSGLGGVAGVSAATGTWLSEVHLYASPATQTYFASGGLDAKANQRVWESFLRKYKIPFKSINSAERLEGLTSGVLLLPSSVVLTQREKQAVLNFRAKGGSVLASWLTGVRGENADWLGFDFMERALGVKVVGSTQADNDENFMMPHGDSPVTHRLPAGQRIWTERPKEWYPLRLSGSNPAAHMMNWSRNFSVGKQTASVVFDEHRQQTGAMSRSVVLGFPERLWLAADRKLLDTMTYDVLEWLLRRPSAYVSAWPHPYTSAFVLTVDATDIIGGNDIAFAKSFEDIGGRATYFTLSELAPMSASLLKTFQDRGHELGYLGDKFDGFKGQAPAKQAKRLDDMRKDFKDAGLNLAADAGFHSPMDSYDKTTEKLLEERQFGHYIAFMDATDARLPFLASSDLTMIPPAKATVILPRTQRGPEDSIEGIAPEDAVPTFLGELDLAEKMAGLSVVRMPNQSFLTSEQWDEIIQNLKIRRDRMWLATSGQVADWWRERERVAVKLDASSTALQLNVSVKGGTPLKHAVTVWINLPEFGALLRASTNGQAGPAVKIAAVDAWRAAVILTGLAPGSYSWQLHFDYPQKQLRN